MNRQRLHLSKNTVTRVVFRYGMPAMLAALLSLPLYADQHAIVRELSTQCEVALALSALPEKLRATATVYALSERGFDMVRSVQDDQQPDGGFSRIVARNHMDALIPQCFDAPGTRAILPKFLDEGRMLRQGMTIDAIAAKTAAALASGSTSRPIVPASSHPRRRRSARQHREVLERGSTMIGNPCNLLQYTMANATGPPSSWFRVVSC